METHEGGRALQQSCVNTRGRLCCAPSRRRGLLRNTFFPCARRRTHHARHTHIETDTDTTHERLIWQVAQEPRRPDEISIHSGALPKPLPKLGYARVLLLLYTLGSPAHVHGDGRLVGEGTAVDAMGVRVINALSRERLAQSAVELRVQLGPARGLRLQSVREGLLRR